MLFAFAVPTRMVKHKSNERDGQAVSTSTACNVIRISSLHAVAVLCPHLPRLSFEWVMWQKCARSGRIDLEDDIGGLGDGQEAAHLDGLPLAHARHLQGHLRENSLPCRTVTGHEQ